MTRPLEFVPIQQMWQKYWLLWSISTENEDDPRLEEPLRQITNVVRELVERDHFSVELLAANDEWLLFKHRILTRLLGETPADEKVIEATLKLVAEMRERGLEIPRQVVQMKGAKLAGKAVSFKGKSGGEDVVEIHEDEDGGQIWNVPIGGTNG